MRIENPKKTLLVFKTGDDYGGRGLSPAIMMNSSNSNFLSSFDRCNDLKKSSNIGSNDDWVFSRLTVNCCTGVKYSGQIYKKFFYLVKCTIRLWNGRMENLEPLRNVQKQAATLSKPCNAAWAFCRHRLRYVAEFFRPYQRIGR